MIRIWASFGQFDKLNLVVGNVTKVTGNTSAKIPAYILELYFGSRLQEQHQNLYKKSSYKSSAQLCTNHTVEELQGKLVLSVLNFPRKQIGKIFSDCLVTGAQSLQGTAEEKRETTIFLTPTVEVEAGCRIGVKAEAQVMEQIERNLNWNEFLKIDLRIGTIKDYNFTELLGGSLGYLKGRVLLTENNEVLPFFGLVHRDFLTNGSRDQQLLFWTNACPKEVAEEYQLENSEKEYMLLCTLNGGKAGIKPAKPVGNGFRVA